MHKWPSNRSTSTMAAPNTKITFEIKPDSYEMLKKIRDKYELPDTSKAVRILLEYAATDGDWDEIFAQVRCRNCG